MRLVLVLLLYPVNVRLQCEHGTIGISCAQTHTQQYSTDFKPYWTHAIYGGRDIRRHQKSTPEQRMERPRMELNLRLPQIHSAIAQPLQPVPQPRSFQISGAASHPQSRHRARARGLALNRDPIDSFERALGGDEFENRKPVEPIRVIRVTEGAEMLEPMHRPGGRPNDMHHRKQQILKSITRHMNEIHPPRVIPFTNRRDDVVKSQLIPPPSEVKVTRIEPSEITKEVTSVEISDAIIDNIISETSIAMNSSDLLQTLSTVDLTSNQTAITNASSVDIVAGFEMSAELRGNDTSSPLVELKEIDKSLEAISSEIQDYDTDEEWEAFNSPNGDKKKPIKDKEQPRTTSTSTPTTTTAVLSAEKDAPITTMRASSEEDQELMTTTQKSTSTTTDGKSVDVSSDESIQDEESQERTTIVSTTTTKSSEEGSKAVVEEVELEVVRTKKKELKKKNKAKKKNENVKDKEEDGNEDKSTTAKPKHKITELNSDTIKSIERNMKEKKQRKKTSKKTKEVEEDKAVEVEEDEEVVKVDVEEVSTTPQSDTSENNRSSMDDSEKKIVKKIEKIKKKKVKNIIKPGTGSQDISEALKQNLRQTIASISEESGQKKENEEAETTMEPDDYDETMNGSRETSNKAEEEEIPSLEEPVGAGAQITDEVESLTTAEPNDDYLAETDVPLNTITIKKSKQKGRVTKKITKKVQQREKEEEDDNEIENKAEDENETTATTNEPEKDNDSENEMPTRKSGKKKLDKKRRRKGKRKESDDEVEEGNGTTEVSTLPIKTGGEDTNIHTDNIKASLKDAPNAKYYYPPKVMVPLPSCFYNPSGYVCCNLQLNNLIEDTFEMIKNVKSFSDCNIARMANIIQQKSEEMFGHPFESVVALSDFAQNVHFAGDLVCKVEIDGKYMLTYATPYDADHAVESVDIIEDVPLGQDDKTEDDEKDTDKITAKRPKKPKKLQKKPLPIHNFRM